jgi:hypothetical protein
VATYNRACFDRETRARYPKMKISAVSCERSIGVSIEAFWTMQHDDAACGSGFIKFESISGANHFVRYDFCCTIFSFLT